MFASLKRRDFALLWTGQTLSRVGDHFYHIALAWWVLQETGSAAMMGAVMVCAFAPMLIFLLIGGVAVDRAKPAVIMLASDVLRGVLVAGITAAEMAGVLELWHIFAASIVFGLVDAFFNPAYATSVPRLVPAEQLPSANALTSLSQQFGRIAGPALGALVVGHVGASWAFAVNAVSFFASAVCIVPLLGPLHVEHAAMESDRSRIRRFYHDLREGIAFVLRTPWLWVGMLMLTFVNVLLAGPYGVALPFLVQRDLGAGVRTLGVIYAMFPIGYAVAALLLGHATRLRRRGAMIFLGAALGGGMIAVMGLQPHVVVVAIAAVVNGFALEVAGLAWTHALQQHVPPGMLGRVSSLDTLGTFALLPLGYALAGWATDAMGAPAVFLTGGAAAAGIALAAGVLHPAVRKLD